MGSLGRTLAPIYDSLAKLKNWPKAEGYDEQGFVASKELDDGRLVAVMPLLFSAGRLTVGAGHKSMLTYPFNRTVPLGYDGGCDQAYDYVTLEAAVGALLVWDGNGEPTGWTKKHAFPPTNDEAG